MTLLMKITIVLLCFSLCGAGTFIVSSARQNDQPQKANVIPVKNRGFIGRVWIVT